MNLIELHILQSFPVTCLNRDDLGSPKSAFFGGVNRARISSQCLKQAQRQLFKELAPEYAQGVRTRLLGKAFQELLEQSHPDVLSEHPDLPDFLACSWGKIVAKKNAPTEPAIATTMTFLSPQEMSGMVTAAIRYYQDATSDNSGQNAVKKPKLQDVVKKALKSVTMKDAADIALFGRMVADDPSLNVEGAAMFTHALSTHRCEPDFDYYTAVDDLQPDDDSGAGMIGTLEFNAACYYRYIALNTDLLKQNLRGVQAEEVQKIVASFIRSALMSVPAARKNSMNGATLPGYVLGLAREGHPLQLVNAFEQAVKSSDGYMEPSKKALQKEFQKLTTTWNISVPVQVELPAEKMTVDDFINSLVEYMS